MPNNNVVFLKNENDKDADDFLTFGANIYTLYSKAFFLKNGLIGEFAKQKISNIINTIKPTENKKYPELSEDQVSILLKEINLIGEPILKNKLMDMLNRCKYKDISFEQFILEKQKQEIEMKLQKVLEKHGGKL